MTKRVFVTGGSRGIGQAIVRRFQADGNEVIAPTRQELDLASVNSVQDYLAVNGLHADILINNAAENTIAEIKDIDLETWNRMLTINLTAPLLLMKAVREHMARKGWGRIVSISSVYSLVNRAGRSGYSSSKAGLNALTRTAAIEFAQDGILVNAVCPGFVETDLTFKNNSAAQLDAIRKQIPLTKMSTPEEIAEFVFFLGSERNTYITGQSLPIDGGFLIQ
jgi:NAD(P)-dependent dehydrogenase (short-subunit alcohol dehydrogenase family)